MKISDFINRHGRLDASRLYLHAKSLGLRRDQCIRLADNAKRQVGQQQAKLIRTARKILQDTV